MKVLLISFHFAEYCDKLAVSLSKDHDVYVVNDKNNFYNELDDWHSRTCSERFDRLLLDNSKFFSIATLKNALAIYKIIFKHKPDVIHVQETPSEIFYFLWPIFLFYRFILTVHDHVAHSGRDSRLKFQKEFVKSLLRKFADHTIVHSELIAEKYSSMYRGSAVSGIPHGVLGEVTDYTENDSGGILFFGRAERYKGLHVLLDAVEMLDNSSFDYNLTIAGRGPEIESNLERIESNHRCNLLHRYLSSSEVDEVFMNASIVVLPYLDATQSGVASLAINFGRAMVGTEVGGLPEVILDSINGFIVPPDDARAIFEKLKLLLCERDRLLAMQRASYDLGRDMFSWDNIATKTVAVYR